jgi:hypothetical protein
MARLSMHLALLQAICCHIKTGPKLSIIDVTQVAFALVRHTFETQVFCLHVHPNLAVSKELFNESQPHIILRHCVGKTWRGWGPSLLVVQAFRRRFSTNRLH